MAPTPRPSAWFWVAVAVGGAAVAFGLRGVLIDRDLTEPLDLGRWVAGLLLLHDLLVVPVVLVVGAAVGRVLPRAAVIPVRLALASAAFVVLLSWPLLRRYGVRDSNPSLLPLPYGRNAVIALAMSWLAIAAVVVGARVLRGRPSPGRPAAAAPPPPAEEPSS